MSFRALRNSLRGRSNSSASGSPAVNGIGNGNGRKREERIDEIGQQRRSSTTSSPSSSVGQTSETSSSNSSRFMKILRFGRRSSSAASKSKAPTLAELTQSRNQRQVVHWASQQTERKRSPTPPVYDEDEESNRVVIIRRSSSSLDGKKSSNEFTLADLTGHGSAVPLYQDHPVEHHDDKLVCTTTSAPVSPVLTPNTHWPPGDSMEEHTDANSMTPSALEEASHPPTDYGMHSVCYIVKDIDRSLEFYEHFLGMELVHTIDNDDHKMYFIGYNKAPVLPQISRRSSQHDVSGASTAVQRASDAVSIRSGRSGHEANFGCRTGLIQLISIPGTERDPSWQVKHTFGVGYQHLSISVPNVARAMRRFKTLGATIVDDGVENQRFGVIEDPDGYNIMIMAQTEGQHAWLTKQVRETMLMGSHKNVNDKGKQKAEAAPAVSEHNTAQVPALVVDPAESSLADTSLGTTTSGGDGGSEPEAPAATPQLQLPPAIASASTSASTSPSHQHQLASAQATGTTVTTTSTLAESTQDAEHLRLIERAQTAKGGTPASFID